MYILNDRTRNRKRIVVNRSTHCEGATSVNDFEGLIRDVDAFLHPKLDNPSRTPNGNTENCASFGLDRIRADQEIVLLPFSLTTK